MHFFQLSRFSDRYFLEYFNYYRIRWNSHSYDLLEDAETKIFASECHL